MQFPTFLKTASGTLAVDACADPSSVVGDVYDVLAAAGPGSPELSLLAGRAIVRLKAALREAAGHPGDSRWRAAFDALSAFIDCYARPGRRTSAPDSFERLSNFLAENADLLTNSAQTQPSRPTVVHAHGW